MWYYLRMQVISLKNNRLTGYIVIGILAAVGLLWLTAGAWRRNYQDLYLVIPHGYSAAPYDVNEIEKTVREGLAVTYEIKGTVEADTGNTEHSVSMVGTNPQYRDIVGLRENEGSFFNDDAWQTGNRYAVLNEFAAFRLFGGSGVVGNTIKLDGRSYLVTGVIGDGHKKEMMVYVPATSIGGIPERLIVRSEEGTGAIRNGLRRLQIYESNSRIVSLSELSQGFKLQLTAVAFLVLLIVFGGGIWRRLKIVGSRGTQFWLRRKSLYTAQLIRAGREDLIVMGGQLGLTALYGMAAIYLIDRIIRMSLEYKDILNQFKYMTDYFFQGKIQWLVRFFYCGPVLFLVIVAVLLMAVAELLNMS